MKFADRSGQSRRDAQGSVVGFWLGSLLPAPDLPSFVVALSTEDQKALPF